MPIFAKRYHDFSCGHRVYQQGSKCENLHGHNYRVHFELEAPELDDVGRVLDFSVIKTLLCEWLEEEWDHKMLIWKDDPWSRYLLEIDRTVVWTPFNPTAENMAKHLVEVIGPQRLAGLPGRLVRVEVEETRKCSAAYMLPKGYCS